MGQAEEDDLRAPLNRVGAQWLENGIGKRCGGEMRMRLAERHAGGVPRSQVGDLHRRMRDEQANELAPGIPGRAQDCHTNGGFSH